jgi:uncharacterized protein YuzE
LPPAAFPPAFRIVDQHCADKPAVILDYDASGNMVSFEILDASIRMPNPLTVEYAVNTPLRRPG